MNVRTKILAAAVLAGSLSSLSGSAGAVPLAASLSLHSASTPMVETVQWRRWGWGRGWGGVGLGLAAGAIIGGAIAASSPYYDYGYGYGYPAYAYSYSYPSYSYAYSYPSYGYSYTYPGYAYSSYAYAPGYRYGYRRWRNW